MTCPLCKGPHNLSKCPRWMIGGKRLKAGLLIRAGSAWIGVHWSSFNRRACINLIPCVTVWITLPGGTPP